MGIGLANRRVLISILVFAILLQGGVARALNLPLVPVSGVTSITPRELRTHLSFLASKELGGRYTFSQGNRIAARYLASQLESYGFYGVARDGSYLQRIEFASKALDRKNT